MHARIATFESDPANVDDAINMVRAQVESGETPPGLEDAKMLMLVNRETGKGVGITLFESEEAMRRGDEALNADYFGYVRSSLDERLGGVNVVGPATLGRNETPIQVGEIPGQRQTEELALGIAVPGEIQARESFPPPRDLPREIEGLLSPAIRMESMDEEPEPRVFLGRGNEVDGEPRLPVLARLDPLRRAFAHITGRGSAWGWIR